MNEQEIKAKREEIDKVIDDHECGYCHYPSSDCGHLWGSKCSSIVKSKACFKQRLSSLGVVIAVEGELPKLPSTALMGMIQAINYEGGYDEAQQDILKAGYKLTVPLEGKDAVRKQQ